jgi:hypothetical protein
MKKRMSRGFNFKYKQSNHSSRSVYLHAHFYITTPAGSRK